MYMASRHDYKSVTLQQNLFLLNKCLLQKQLMEEVNKQQIDKHQHKNHHHNRLTPAKYVTNLICRFRHLRSHDGAAAPPDRDTDAILLPVPAHGDGARSARTNGPRRQLWWCHLSWRRHVVLTLTAIFTGCWRLRTALSASGQGNVVARKNAGLLGAVRRTWVVE